MKSRNFAIFSVLAAALVFSTIAAFPIAPESALAYEKNQATSQTSACGNEFIPINIGCQNTDSQIQGDENAAALTAQQTFPEVKLVQEKPTPKPMTATLEVCKDTASTEGTYEFIVTGNNPSPEQFSLMPGDCQDVTINSGNYMISEEDPFPGQDVSVTVIGDCTLTSDEPPISASGNIQAGETQSCSFLNIVEEPEPQTCEECLTAFLTPEQIAGYEEATNLSPELQCQRLESSLFDSLEFERAINGMAFNLGAIGVDDETIQQIIECMERVFGIQTEEPIES
jgi:hypothetical protein